MTIFTVANHAASFEAIMHFEYLSISMLSKFCENSLLHPNIILSSDYSFTVSSPIFLTDD
jgi:hypothetical protein